MTNRGQQTRRWLSATIAIFSKDIRSELRTRYALNALIMFVITTLAIVLFAIGHETASPDILSGVLWVVVFFSTMSGLSRTFVSEEERGTTMMLQLIARPSMVYFGKLLFNTILLAGINVVTITLYLVLIAGFHVRSLDVFVITFILGTFGLSSAATIIAAIIAKANTKGSLYPVLSFPILLPLLVTLINATRLAVEGAPVSDAFGEFQILVSYLVVMTAISYILFDYVWKD